MVIFTEEEFNKFSLEYTIDKATKILEAINNNKNVVCIGMGGSSKTYSITYVIEELIKSNKITSNEYAICAYTGVASTNASGATFNSTFQFPTNIVDIKETARKWAYKVKKVKSYELVKELLDNLKILIHDEFSMLSNKFMNFMNFAFQFYYGNNKLFGGILFINLGDPLQLLAVEQNEKGEPDCCIDLLTNPEYVKVYFDFGFRYIKKIINEETNEITYELNEDWVNYLSNLRYGNVEYVDENLLYKLGIKVFTMKEYIKHLDELSRILICSLNKTRDNFNEGINEIYKTKGIESFTIDSELFEIEYEPSQFDIINKKLIKLADTNNISFIENILKICKQCNFINYDEMFNKIKANDRDKFSNKVYIKKINNCNLSFNKSAEGDTPISIPLKQNGRQDGIYMCRINKPGFKTMKYSNIANGTVLKLLEYKDSEYGEGYCIMTLKLNQDENYKIGKIYRYNYNMFNKKLTIALQYPFIQSDSNNAHLVQGLTLLESGFLLDEQIPWYSMYHSHYVVSSRVKDPNNFIYIYSKENNKKFKSYQSMEEILSEEVQMKRLKLASIKIKKLVKIYKPILNIVKELEKNE